MSCLRGEHRFTPIVDVALIAEGEKRSEALARRLAAAGVADAPLVIPLDVDAEPRDGESLAAGEA